MTTEAGKRLLNSMTSIGPFDEAAIAAIEAETVAAERERITAGVEGLPKWDKRTVPGGFHVNRAAVLAIVEDKP